MPKPASVVMVMFWNHHFLTQVFPCFQLFYSGAAAGGDSGAAEEAAKEEEPEEEEAPPAMDVFGGGKTCKLHS